MISELKGLQSMKKDIQKFQQRTNSQVDLQSMTTKPDLSRNTKQSVQRYSSQTNIGNMDKSIFDSETHHLPEIVTGGREIVDEPFPLKKIKSTSKKRASP